MSFTEELCAASEPVFSRTVAHPFIGAVADGSLSEATFAFYLQQDSWFLQQEGGSIGQAIAKAPDLATAGTLGRFIDGVSQAERNRHRHFAERLGRPLGQDSDFEPAPTALAYVNHLHATAALGDFGAVMAALLPCPWIYRSFGLRLAETEPPHPVYREWLSWYKQDYVGERVAEQRRLLDGWAERASATQRAAAARAFDRSVRYEEMFFTMAWRNESWADVLGAPDGAG